LGCRLSVFHGYTLGIFHFFLGTAFDTVRLHEITSSLAECIDDKLLPLEWQYGEELSLLELPNHPHFIGN
jgi:hypothetical protein